MLIVSQKFHCERALFLSKANDMHSKCFVAKDVSGVYSTKVKARELLARVKAILDVYVLNTKPKYLGKKVLVTTNQS